MARNNTYVSSGLVLARVVPRYCGETRLFTLSVGLLVRGERAGERERDWSDERRRYHL